MLVTFSFSFLFLLFSPYLSNKLLFCYPYHFASLFIVSRLSVWSATILDRFIVCLLRFPYTLAFYLFLLFYHFTCSPPPSPPLCCRNPPLSLTHPFSLPPSPPFFLSPLFALILLPLLLWPFIGQKLKHTFAPYRQYWFIFLVTPTAKHHWKLMCQKKKKQNRKWSNNREINHYVNRQLTYKCGKTVIQNETISGRAKWRR